MWILKNLHNHRGLNLFQMEISEDWQEGEGLEELVQMFTISPKCI